LKGFCAGFFMFNRSISLGVDGDDCKGNPWGLPFTTRVVLSFEKRSLFALRSDRLPVSITSRPVKKIPSREQTDR
jgi:hypothetical protein